MNRDWNTYSINYNSANTTHPQSKIDMNAIDKLGLNIYMNHNLMNTSDEKESDGHCTERSEPRKLLMARSNPFSTGRLRPRCAPFVNQHGNTTGKLREKSKKNSAKSKKKAGRRTNIKDSPLIINKLKYKIYENGFKS